MVREPAVPAARARCDRAPATDDSFSRRALRLVGDPGEEVGPRAGVDDVRGLDPGPASLVDAPAEEVELLGPVGVRVDDEPAAGLDGQAGPLDRQVEAMVGAVHLEGGAGLGGGGEDRLPVEVEVVAGLDHPAGRVGDDVDVGVADRAEDPGRQLLARLAAPDMERGDDDVVAGEERVGVVEPAIGPDLELAAVEEAEPLGRGLGRRRPGGLLALEPLVERADDRAAGRRPAPGSGLGRWPATGCGR